MRKKGLLMQQKMYRRTQLLVLQRGRSDRQCEC